MRNKFKNLIILIFSTLIITLFISCPNSISDTNLTKSKVHDYQSVDESDLPTFSLEGYNSGIEEDSDAPTLIEDNYLEYVNCLQNAIGSTLAVFNSFDPTSQTMYSTRDINSEFIFQIYDDNLSIKNNDDDSQVLSLDVDWFDIYLKGSSPENVIDILLGDADSIASEFDVVVSAEFSESVMCTNDLIASIFAEIKINNDGGVDSNPYISGELDVSFASRYLDTANNLYYNLGGELIIDEFSNFTEAKFNQILGIIMSSIGDGSQVPDYEAIASQVQNVIWGDDANHISLTLTIGDDDESLGRKTLYLSDCLPVLLPMLMGLLSNNG